MVVGVAQVVQGGFDRGVCRRFGCAAITSVDAAVMVNEVVFVVVGGYAEVGFDFGLFGVADVGLVESVTVARSVECYK